MRYDVYTYLAGCSSVRRWRRSYKSLAWATKYAESLTGYGIIGTVVPR